MVALERIVDVVAQLRHPETGCPWDLEQTHKSLIPYVIEEAYEVVDAIQVGEQEAIAEELGDLLLQVVLQAQVASDNQEFDLATVANGIADKLIRRHPHVFGDVNVASTDEVHQNWERIKAEEKGRAPRTPQAQPKSSPKYNRIPAPADGRQQNLRPKPPKQGFEWDDIRQRLG